MLFRGDDLCNFLEEQKKEPCDEQIPLEQIPLSRVNKESLNFEPKCKNWTNFVQDRLGLRRNSNQRTDSDGILMHFYLPQEGSTHHTTKKVEKKLQKWPMKDMGRERKIRSEGVTSLSFFFANEMTFRTFWMRTNHPSHPSKNLSLTKSTREFTRARARDTFSMRIHRRYHAKWTDLRMIGVATIMPMNSTVSPLHRHRASSAITTKMHWFPPTNSAYLASFSVLVVVRTEPVSLWQPVGPSG